MLTDKQGRILVRLARQEIELMLEQVPLDPPGTEQLQDPAFLEKRAVFVTLHKRKALRGCIGSLSAVESILEGVRRHAVNAAFHDNRFSPVTVEEIKDLDIEVSVLTEPERLDYEKGEDLLNLLLPSEHGVIIKAPGGAGATFLPQVWEQLPVPADFLGRLCMKAGLNETFWKSGSLEIYTYRVQLFKETR